jgi:hypothetical protein
MTPATLVGNGAQALIPITQSLGTFWANAMQNGPPTPNDNQGTFLLDFALKFTGTGSSAGVSLNLYLQDNISSSPSVIEIGPFVAKFGAIGLAAEVPNRVYLFPSVAVRVQPARTQGFRRLTGLRIQKVVSGAQTDTIGLASSGPCAATWFNQTIPFGP